jgi:hypothetical protein
MDALALVCPAGHAIELRAPRIDGTDRTIVSRFGTGEFEAAAEEAARLSGRAPAVYLVMNGVDPAMACGRERRDGGAKAENVPRRVWLLVDADPKRPRTVNATEAEKAAGYALALKVRDALVALGWPEPVIADSGNGYHLLFRIDLPADDVFVPGVDGKPAREDGPSTLLVKRVLAALAARFNGEAAAVDTVVYDLPRLVKLYGTRVCKGKDTPERPARYARILRVPETLTPVPVALLESVAGETPSPAPPFELGAEVECKRSQAAGGGAEANGHPREGITFTATNGRPDDETRAVAYLAKCEPAVSGQRGHSKAFKAACKVGPGFDLPPEVSLRLLRTHYNPRCEPPWSEKELRHKVEDAYRVEARRGWLRDAERNGKTSGNNRNAKGNGRGGATGEGAEESDDWIDRGQIADLGDVRRAVGAFKYAWEKWIQPGSISTVAADAGTGKTLVALKLCQIVWYNDPWPDGSVNGMAKGRPSLWLCYDRAWHGIMRAAAKLGVPDEAVLLPTSKGRPLWVPDLDDLRTILALERMIRKFQPWALIIDTMTYATGANVARAHEAKLAYSPLMGVMAETGCCCLSHTHLSSEGQVLNRRPTELSRTVLKLKAPDPGNHKRLRFWVHKTDDEKPPPLGVTLGGDALVTFDDCPPLDDDGPRPRGPQPEKSTGFAEWLFQYLEPGPSLLAAVIDAARDQKLLKSPDAKNSKPSLTPLYNARDRVPRVFPGWVIEEFLGPSPTGRDVKHWQRARGEEPRDEQEVPF